MTEQPQQTDPLNGKAAGEPGPAPQKPGSATLTQQPDKSSSGLAALALLIAISAAGLACWQWWQNQQVVDISAVTVNQFEAFNARLDEMAAGSDSALTQIRNDIARLSSQRGEIDRVKQQLAEAAGDIQASVEQVHTLQLRDGERSAKARVSLGRLEANERRLQGLAQQFQALSGVDHGAWQIEEASQLMRLAEQRLILAGDHRTAERLLSSADSIVRDIGDASLYSLRAAISSDLAVLRAIPSLDLNGLYLRLDTLQDQISQLPIDGLRRNLPASEHAEDAPAVDGTWRAVVQRAWTRLRELVVVRRLEGPTEALLPPDQEINIRQNLRLWLQQAQLALFRADTVVYRSTLARAARNVSQWFETSDPRVSAFQAELDALGGATVVVELPDLTASLAALRAYRALLAPADEPAS